MPTCMYIIEHLLIAVSDEPFSLLLYRSSRNGTQQHDARPSNESQPAGGAAGSAACCTVTKGIRVCAETVLQLGDPHWGSVLIWHNNAVYREVISKSLPKVLMHCSKVVLY